MPAEIEDLVAARQEIWDLLRQQVETLGSSQELTDRQLIECYNRQLRVQELRERLENLSTRGIDATSSVDEVLVQNPATPSLQEVLLPLGAAA